MGDGPIFEIVLHVRVLILLIPQRIPHMDITGSEMVMVAVYLNDQILTLASKSADPCLA